MKRESINGCPSRHAPERACHGLKGAGGVGLPDPAPWESGRIQTRTPANQPQPPASKRRPVAPKAVVQDRLASALTRGTVGSRLLFTYAMPRAEGI